MTSISFQQYTHNKMMHHNTPFTITRKGVGYYRLNGRLMTMKEFNRIFPIDVIPKVEKSHAHKKGDNPSKSGRWMNGVRAY